MNLKLNKQSKSKMYKFIVIKYISRHRISIDD